MLSDLDVKTVFNNARQIVDTFWGTWFVRPNLHRACTLYLRQNFYFSGVTRRKGLEFFGKALAHG